MPLQPGDESNSVGLYLRQEREKRGITADQVASGTRINIRHIHSLESDEYDHLPAKPFVRGFVAAYARFVGLDSQDVLTRFQAVIDERCKEAELPEAESARGYAFEKRGDAQNRTWLWVVMVSFLVLGGAGYVVFKPYLKHSRLSNAERLRAAHATPSPSPSESVIEAQAEPAPDKVPEKAADKTADKSKDKTEGKPVQKPVEKVAEKAPAPNPAPTGVAPETPKPETPAANDPLDSGKALTPSEIKHKLVVKMKEDVWVRYQVDERAVRKFVVRKGNTLVLRATNVIRFQVSDAQNTLMNYNSTGTRPFTSYAGFSGGGATPTAIYPPEMKEKLPEVFAQEKPLSPSVPGSPNPTETKTPQ